MTMHTVYSNLAMSVEFVNWSDESGTGRVPTPVFRFTVRGGRGVTDPVTNRIPDIAQGTEIDKDTYAGLMANPTFKEYLELGWIWASEKRKSRSDAKTVASLTDTDNSAVKQGSDFNLVANTHTRNADTSPEGADY